jgi:IS5 family transposase
MVGLLILKHIRNISDESIVEQWAKNLYYQYFCGQQEFSSMEPCAASELVHFRIRIGESGIELILKESIRINGNDSNDSNDDQVSVDTTV